MRAVVKFTLPQEGAHLAEAPRQFIVWNAPARKLADTWRINHIAAFRQRVQFGYHRGVAALAHRLAHLANAQAEARLYRIEQAAFAHP
jgi:hypothetical protein